LFSASTSTLGLGTPSQDEADNCIAALEAELTALWAQIDANEEEQSEYDDFDDFDASSHISPQHAVASSQNQYLSPQTSIHPLYASIEPIFELTPDIIDLEKNTVTLTPDLEILSQDIADDRIAALEAELAALQAQTSSDEEEQPQYDNFDDQQFDWFSASEIGRFDSEPMFIALKLDCITFRFGYTELRASLGPDRLRKGRKHSIWRSYFEARFHWPRYLVDDLRP